MSKTCFWVFLSIRTPCQNILPHWSACNSFGNGKHTIQEVMNMNVAVCFMSFTIEVLFRWQPTASPGLQMDVFVLREQDPQFCDLATKEQFDKRSLQGISFSSGEFLNVHDCHAVDNQRDGDLHRFLSVHSTIKNQTNNDNKNKTSWQQLKFKNSLMEESSLQRNSLDENSCSWGCQAISPRRQLTVLTCVCAVSATSLVLWFLNDWLRWPFECNMYSMLFPKSSASVCSFLLEGRFPSVQHWDSKAITFEEELALGYTHGHRVFRVLSFETQRYSVNVLPKSTVSVTLLDHCSLRHW